MEEVTVAIDPGLRHCGYAFFIRDELREAALIEGDVVEEARAAHAWRDMGGKVASAVQDNCYKAGQRFSGPRVFLRLAIEQMQADARTNRTQAESVLHVAAVTGSIVFSVYADRTSFYTPREWTRGMPKKVRARRVWGRLSALERRALEDAVEGAGDRIEKGSIGGKLDHILDAIGIGLHSLGRLHR